MGFFLGGGVILKGLGWITDFHCVTLPVCNIGVVTFYRTFLTMMPPPPHISICVCFSPVFLSFSLSFLLTKDIPNQCSPSPCNPGGTVRCEDKKGDFLCHCFTGWAGARCEQGNVTTVGRHQTKPNQNELAAIDLTTNRPVNVIGRQFLQFYAVL